MKRLTWIGLAGLLCVALTVPVISAANLREQDQLRLTEVKERHATELERAAQSYYAQVQRANRTLETNYQRMIESYDRRGDSETVEALQAELAELLASASEPPAGPEPEANREPGHVRLIQSIGPRLVDAGNNFGQTESLASKDYVLLYFSAGWCPPCRAFTPSLVDFRNRHAERGNFEVVFVSSDRSPNDMFKYMGDYNINFPAVPFNRIEASRLRNTYGGRGIPNLVIVDREGEVVSGSYVDGQYVGPRKVLADMEQLLR
ncbi:thioredoxin-like domain-containing protein [Phycisphaerales bacterium AB-hyl4]|uniref:Thioredoxin-like domain-containing protein n=1 Tax=Natronomicrosphaera hydrolytica TaxID=3242702 RepID=A0ABV4U4V6_9BACT